MNVTNQFRILFCLTLVFVHSANAGDRNNVSVDNRYPTNNIETASNTSMRERLLNGFGGKAILQDINTFTTHLTVSGQGSEQNSSQDNESTHTKTFMDFEHERIVQASRQHRSLIMIDEDRAAMIKDGKSAPLPTEQRQRMLDNMRLNFLYFLRNPNLALAGPITVPAHPELSWWKLKVGEHESPPLGLDKATGQIRKVLFPDGKFIVESDYQTLHSGLIWPQKFRLFDGKKIILEGNYSHVLINSEPNLNTYYEFLNSQ